MRVMAMVAVGVLAVLVLTIGVVLLAGEAPAPDGALATSTPTHVATGPTATPASSAVASPSTSPAQTPTAVLPSPTPATPDPGPTATPTTDPATPPPSAAEWQRFELFVDEADDRRQSAPLRAALQLDGDERLFLEPPTIAVDRDGHAHVTWSSFGFREVPGSSGLETGAILYATNASGKWRLKELTTRSDDWYDAADTVAVDADGTVAVAFMRISIPQYDATTHLMLKRAGRWSEPIAVPYPYDPARKQTLAIRDGVVHIAYVTRIDEEDRRQVRYAQYADGRWSDSLVGEIDTGSAPDALVLGLTEEGNVRVAYAVDHRVVFSATRQDETFASDPPLELATPWHRTLLLALDAQGGLHAVSDRYYFRREAGGWSTMREVFPRVTWVDGCGDRVARGPWGHALRVAATGAVQAVSFFDGPFFDSPWYARDRGSGTEFVALKLSRPAQLYEAGTRIRQTIEDCLRDTAIDFFDPIGLDMTIDAQGRPHILTTNRDYFIGPAD